MEKKSEILIYPTDTLWGLGGGIGNFKIGDKVRSVKKSQDKRPFSILFTPDLFRDYFDIVIDDAVFDYEVTFLIHEKHLLRPVAKDLRSEFIGVRVLNSPVVKEVINYAGEPVITTSLNLASELPANNFKEACEFQKNHAPMAKIFSGEKVPSGFSSTIIKMSNPPEILREGKFVVELKTWLSGHWPCS